MCIQMKCILVMDSISWISMNKKRPCMSIKIFVVAFSYNYQVL